MPPPLKLIVTGEHEEVLWERKFLNTDTSLGMIQAVIFYLIKCFGLWQGKDLKSLKTEHVSFGEENLGKFVLIDVKKALGSGKVIKRYDDPDNPRSVYKILKTYKGYLANEGPFLVRPISSIKDYICYSPWPLGVNIIEQTVVNLMQECGVGPGFGNISVCLMAIDILKSFGAGSHCISTWLFRLYPRYKKTFWADMFKKCCAINCEDKSQEACLMISHILDPPYPAATMLFEMRKRQEVIKNKLETVTAQRTHVFNSWLSNINSQQESECENDLSLESEHPSDSHMKTKITLKALTAAKGHGLKTRAGNVKEALKKKLNLGENSSDSNDQSGCPLNLPETSQISIKIEPMSEVDLHEKKSDDTDVKILTVLSIPESAYSEQVDEAECAIDKKKIVPSTSQGFTRTGAPSRSEHCILRSKSFKRVGKRKLKRPVVSDKEAEPKVKQSKPLIKTEQMDSSSTFKGDEASQPPHDGDVLEEADHERAASNVKLELESDCEDNKTAGGHSLLEDTSENNEAASGHSLVLEDTSKNKETSSGRSLVLEDTSGDKHNRTNVGNTLHELLQSDCAQNKNGISYPLSSEGNSGETLSHGLEDEDSNSLQNFKCNSSQVIVANQNERSHSSLDVSANQNEISHSSHVMKDKPMPPAVTPSCSSFVCGASEQIKDSAVIHHKQLNCQTKDSTAIHHKQLNCQTKDSTAIHHKQLNCQTKDNTAIHHKQLNCQTKDSQVIDHKQLNCHNKSFVKVSASNDCDEPRCECTTLNVNESLLGRTTKAKCVAGSCRELKMETKCDGNMCSHGKETVSNIVDDSCKVRCTDVGASAVCTSSNREHSNFREKLVNSGKTFNHWNTEGHLATDLVHFLDAAHKQLQNILKTSSVDANPQCSCQDGGADKSSHSSKIFRQKRTLGVTKDLRSNKTTKVKEKSCDHFKSSHAARPSDCLQSPGHIFSEEELKKAASIATDKSCSLLRSVVEENRTSLAKTRKSKLYRNLMSKTRTKLRFVSLRLKPPLTLQTQLEPDRTEKRHCGNRVKKMLPHSSQKPPRKHPNVVKQSSDDEATYTNCRLPNKQTSSEIVPPKFCVHCNHSPSTNVSPEASLLKEASENSPPKSGIYHYKSDYHENAVYQMLQIKQENHGTTTYTISDLPIHVDGSNAQRDPLHSHMDPLHSHKDPLHSHKDPLHAHRSEVCLGDYFPEGTVIPARGLKLLTRQSATGLELVLKFDFDLCGNASSDVNKGNHNETDQNTGNTEVHSELVNDRQAEI